MKEPDVVGSFSLREAWVPFLTAAARRILLHFQAVAAKRNSP
jgi:hypothetical protein